MHPELLLRYKGSSSSLLPTTFSSTLVETANFETDEALFTGESLPVQKGVDAIFHEGTGPGDRLNIAFSSSTVMRGRAWGIAISTGMNTKISLIATALHTSDSKHQPVKCGPEGETKKWRHFKAWILTCTDAVGHFLDVNIGIPFGTKCPSWLSFYSVLLSCLLLFSCSQTSGLTSKRQSSMQLQWV